MSEKNTVWICISEDKKSLPGLTLQEQNEETTIIFTQQHAKGQHLAHYLGNNCEASIMHWTLVDKSDEEIMLTMKEKKYKRKTNCKQLYTFNWSITHRQIFTRMEDLWLDE